AGASARRPRAAPRRRRRASRPAAASGACSIGFRRLVAHRPLRRPAQAARVQLGLLADRHRFGEIGERAFALRTRRRRVVARILGEDLGDPRAYAFYLLYFRPDLDFERSRNGFTSRSAPT